MVMFALVLPQLAGMIGSGAALMFAVIIIELVGSRQVRTLPGGAAGEKAGPLTASQASPEEGNFLA